MRKSIMQVDRFSNVDLGAAIASEPHAVQARLGWRIGKDWFLLVIQGGLANWHPSVTRRCLFNAFWRAVFRGISFGGAKPRTYPGVWF